MNEHPQRSDRPLRVVHVSTVHGATDARIFYREAMTLHDLGFEVTVVGRYPGDTTIGGVAVRGLPDPPGRIVRILIGWYRGLKAVRAVEADVYHFHDFELMPAALLARMVLGKHTVYDAHEDVTLMMLKAWVPSVLRRPLTAVVRWVDAFCARRVDAVVVPTRLLYEKYRRLARRVQMFINYPAPLFLRGRDADWIPYDERRKQVVHLGTLSERRLRFVVDLARRFLDAHPDWSWQLLGLHPATLEQFREVVRDGAGGRLTAVGKVPHDEIAAHLCRARIGINYHPLDYEHIKIAIPVKVFEYLACGLPVVTTRVPLLVELVEDCPAVALCDDDPESYLAALEAMVAREDLAEMSGAAQHFSDQRFNCRIEGEGLARLYEEICRGRKSDA